MEAETLVPLAGNWVMEFARPPIQVEVLTAEKYFRDHRSAQRPGERLLFANGQTCTLKLNIAG